MFSPLSMKSSAKKQRVLCGVRTEGRHDHILSDSECAGEHTATECREIVFVAMPDLFDEAMGAQTFQPVGGTAGGEIPEMGSEIGSAKATDVPLPAGEGDQETIVFAEEQIETPIGAVVLSCRFGHFVDSLQRAIHLIQVTSTGCGLAAVSPNQTFIPHWRRSHGLLNQSIEEFGPAAGLASVESERELVEVIIQMLAGDSTLVGAQQPPLQQGRHPRQQNVFRIRPQSAENPPTRGCSADAACNTTTSSGNLSQSYNYKLCMKGKGGGVFLMVFEIINSY